MRSRGSGFQIGGHVPRPKKRIFPQAQRDASQQADDAEFLSADDFDAQHAILSIEIDRNQIAGFSIGLCAGYRPMAEPHIGSRRSVSISTTGVRNEATRSLLRAVLPITCNEPAFILFDLRNNDENFTAESSKEQPDHPTVNSTSGGRLRIVSGSSIVSIAWISEKLRSRHAFQGERCREPKRHASTSLTAAPGSELQIEVEHRRGEKDAVDQVQRSADPRDGAARILIEASRFTTDSARSPTTLISGNSSPSTMLEPESARGCPRPATRREPR